MVVPSGVDITIELAGREDKWNMGSWGELGNGDGLLVLWLTVVASGSALVDKDDTRAAA